MTVTQLIYMSQPFGFDRAVLAGILTGARRNNARDGITGALVCRHDVYLQLIEGEAAAIDDLFERISRDDRHLEVTVLHRFDESRRIFPDWAMLDDPARSWLWSPAEIAAGALIDAPAAEVRAVFTRIASEIAAD